MKRVHLLAMVAIALTGIWWGDYKERREIEKRVAVLDIAAEFAGKLQVTRSVVDDALEAHRIAVLDGAIAKAERIAAEARLDSLRRRSRPSPVVVPDTCLPFAQTIADQQAEIMQSGIVIEKLKAENVIMERDTMRMAAALVTVRQTLADTADALGKTRRALAKAITVPLTNTVKRRTLLGIPLPTPNVGVDLVSIDDQARVTIAPRRLSLSLGYSF